jgi:hypothetical protein
MGVNESVYTLATFTVRFGSKYVYEMRTKWLKFVVRDVYKIKFVIRDVYKIVEIPYTRCVQNG